MKKAALLLTALLTLSACQKKAETTSTTPATTETNSTETASTGTDSAGTATGAASGATVTTPGALPSGYTLVPFLSQSPVREFKTEPAMTLQQGKDYYALIDTDKGQVLVDLYEQETPVTVNNFVTLARNHFYDGTRFHRVIDGFMAQGGDPQSTDTAKKDAWGSGGPGYSFADEIRSKLTFSGAGELAMANSGPNTNGSQFFITFGPTENLNGRHTIFGKVVTGEDVLGKLTRTSDTSSGSETPIAGATPDEVLSVRILTKG
ncbi:peptidylprolyl isomerase [Deinococcus gobiensis]|uniref:peptidylprolyl isomerase n=1 Tax=Deinococcus gobiensis TaxID=502394 RepID=UPI0002EAB372|nr:peptidylprolyl isomerase [Deinococcus gobiensis]